MPAAKTAPPAPAFPIEHDVVRAAKALAHPVRRAIVQLLAGRKRRLSGEAR